MDKQLTTQVKDFATQAEAWVVKNIYPEFTLATIKTDWNRNRRSHRGGYYSKGPGINIAMRLLKTTPVGVPIRFYEYKAYDSDAEIGGFFTNNSEHYNQAIILHEVSHAVQYYSYKLNSFRCKPHGIVFKNYYRQLRKEFLNYKLPEQKKLRAEYEYFIRDIQNHNYNMLKTFISS